MIVSLDTTGPDYIVVIRDGENVSTTRKSGARTSSLLSLIHESLRDQPGSVTGITVAVGPGSFTGTRVGVATANALGYAWSVPVNGRPIGRGAMPVYASDPHITPSTRT